MNSSSLKVIFAPEQMEMRALATLSLVVFFINICNVSACTSGQGPEPFDGSSSNVEMNQKVWSSIDDNLMSIKGCEDNLKVHSIHTKPVVFARCNCIVYLCLCFLVFLLIDI